MPRAHLQVVAAVDDRGDVVVAVVDEGPAVPTPEWLRALAQLQKLKKRKRGFMTLMILIIPRSMGMEQLKKLIMRLHRTEQLY
jgi:hypothetical protein